MDQKIKVLFDTNILVYAHDESASYHTDSAELLKLAVEHQIQGVLAEQNLIELYRILTNSVAMKGIALSSLDANNLINSVYLNGDFEILYPTKLTLKKVLELAVKNKIISAQIFDIRLIALILEYKIDYLATYNINHFQGISDINPLKPLEIINLINNLN